MIIKTMKTLQMDEQTALRLYPGADAAFKEMLEQSFTKEFFNQKITDRVKTFNDALALVTPSNNLKRLLAYNGFDTVLNGAQAMAKLQIIATALNEGWKPDWKNSSQYKWYPWFKKSGSGLSFDVAAYWYLDTYVCSRLCFKSKELAIYSAEQFKDIYTKYMAF